MHDQGVANKKELVKKVMATIPHLNTLSLIFLL